MATIIQKRETSISMEDLQRAVREGRASDIVKVGDQILINFDGEDTPYDVIGIDAEELADPEKKHSVTIQAHNLIEEHPFDTSGTWGSNNWESSELRAYLNSNEYKERYRDLIPYLTPVKKKNGKKPDTEELFFLPSKDEYDPDLTPYPFYKIRGNAIKTDEDGDPDWHWTRSAYRGYASGVWIVRSTGAVGYGHARTAYRCAPACVIG